MNLINFIYGVVKKAIDAATLPAAALPSAVIPVAVTGIVTAVPATTCGHWCAVDNLNKDD